MEKRTRIIRVVEFFSNTLFAQEERYSRDMRKAHKLYEASSWSAQIFSKLKFLASMSQIRRTGGFSVFIIFEKYRFGLKTVLLTWKCFIVIGSTPRRYAHDRWMGWRMQWRTSRCNITSDQLVTLAGHSLLLQRRWRKFQQNVLLGTSS